MLVIEKPNATTRTVLHDTAPTQQPKLLDRIRSAIRTKHYSLRTEQSYTHWAKRFILWHNKRHPADMGAQEVEAFLSALATDRNVSASTQNVAKHAILFLYKQVLGVDLPWLDGITQAKESKRLPTVLTKSEVQALLRHVHGTNGLIIKLLYGTGMRLMEALRLRVKDLDIERGTFDYAVTFPESPRRFLFVEYKGSGITLETWLETWLNRQKQHLKSSTYDDYRKIVFNTLIPEIGTVYITDIRRSHVRDMCDKMTVSNKRLANIQSVIRSALQDAIDDELIESNPLYGWKYARKEAPKQVDDIDPFSMEEQHAILAACRHPQYLNLFKFAFWTGLRTSEIVALVWGDIDWIRGIIRVSRAKTQAGDEPEGTKTRKGTRDVKLLPPALEALTAQKEHSYLQNGAIFLNPRTGEAWTGDQPIRHGAWGPAIRLSGVRYRRPYQTRHTYASMMLTAGESPIWLAQQMGHSDTTMIFKIYGRWIPSATPDAGGKAVEMFSKKAAEKLPKVG